MVAALAYGDQALSSPFFGVLLPAPSVGPGSGWAPPPAEPPGGGYHAGPGRRNPGLDVAGRAQAADRHSDGGGGLLRGAPRFSHQRGAPF